MAWQQSSWAEAAVDPPERAKSGAAEAASASSAASRSPRGGRRGESGEGAGGWWEVEGARWGECSSWEASWQQRGEDDWRDEVPEPWYIDRHDLVLEPSDFGAHRYTIVVLHSCSGGPDDFTAFFHRLSTPLRRHIRAVVPCSPIRLESSPGWSREQNSWFEYDDDSADGNDLKFPEQLVEQRRRILTLLENERRRLPDMDTRRILLWGMSQGVGLAIDVALHAPFPLAGVLALRGMALREGLPESTARASPVRVLAINGQRDRLCPPDAARPTYEALRAHGAQVEIVVEPSLGHACARGRQQLNAAELRRVNAFVSEVWKDL